ncbi:ParA family protein [Borrelia turicatae]|uniref:PF-32-type protein n=1 Tax=Borrelia turicatae (strain 91E135) TaxID=314724 RepID=A0ABF7R075_BORT9|nr:ParA family protein [Borrelia turicatae]ASJ27789.1 PF-32-type protein [Borrelia turicatae 91E135]UPA14255.1 ParA family protein [Borrelia turicatae 91E135]
MDRKKPTIITIASIKGGVGKSTSALIFATLLAQKHKVLLIDIDTQASVTSYFYRKVKELYTDLVNKNIYEVLIDKISINKSIISIDSNLDLIPSYVTLHKVNRVAYKYMLKEFKLKIEIGRLENNYDYVILDTNPSLDFTLTNALVCSDYVIVPMTAEKWAVESFEVLDFFIKELEIFLPIYILITRFKKNNTHKYLLDILKSKNNFLGTISEREDLNKKIADNCKFDLCKDYMKEYDKILSTFLYHIDNSLYAKNNKINFSNRWKNYKRN